MDKYQNEIDYLTEHPDEIFLHWKEIRSGLFDVVDRGAEIYDDSSPAGCLTQIRGKGKAAFIKGKMHEELTASIRADERIPAEPNLITVSSLPVFAEWQREIDRLEAA